MRGLRLHSGEDHHVTVAASAAKASLHLFNMADRLKAVPFKAMLSRASPATDNCYWLILNATPSL